MGQSEKLLSCRAQCIFGGHKKWGMDKKQTQRACKVFSCYTTEKFEIYIGQIFNFYLVKQILSFFKKHPNL